VTKWDYGRMCSLLREAALALTALADEHEQEPDAIKSVYVVRRAVMEVERTLKTIKALLKRARLNGA
jgi:hypothetical protein